MSDIKDNTPWTTEEQMGDNNWGKRDPITELYYNNRNERDGIKPQSKIMGNNILSHPTIWDSRHNPEFNTDEGMLLIDAIAIQVLPEVMRQMAFTWGKTSLTPEHMKTVADNSYLQATAMLKERQKYI